MSDTYLYAWRHDAQPWASDWEFGRRVPCKYGTRVLIGKTKEDPQEGRSGSREVGMSCSAFLWRISGGLMVEFRHEGGVNRELSPWSPQLFAISLAGENETRAGSDSAMNLS